MKSKKSGNLPVPTVKACIAQNTKLHAVGLLHVILLLCHNSETTGSDSGRSFIRKVSVFGSLAP